jgi:hypothetical protein
MQWFVGVWIKAIIGAISALIGLMSQATRSCGDSGSIISAKATVGSEDRHDRCCIDPGRNLKLCPAVIDAYRVCMQPLSIDRHQNRVPCACTRAQRYLLRDVRRSSSHPRTLLWRWRLTCANKRLLGHSLALDTSTVGAVVATKCGGASYTAKNTNASTTLAAQLSTARLEGVRFVTLSSTAL